MTIKTVKAKLAKAKQKVKGKIAAKIKGKKKCKACAYACFAVLLFCGCQQAQPASRSTTATYGDTKITIEEHAKNNKVTVIFREGAFASADSAGSTETQTASPVMEIKPDIDVKYNDALQAATAASRGVLERLTDAGANAVLRMMAGKQTGNITVPTQDGDTITVHCEDGQCAECDECEYTK